MRTRHWAPGSVCLLLLFGAILGLRSLSNNLRSDLALRKLPDLPSLSDHNETTVTLLEEADRVLHVDPLSSQSRERMAQLYDAHQFYDEVAVLYRVLIGDQPHSL